MENGKLVEKSRIRQKSQVQLVRDIEPYQNMVDRKWITGRRQHREFLKANNLVEVGNEQNNIT